MSGNTSECHLYEEMEPLTYFYYLIFLMGIIGSCFALWAFTQKDQKQKCMSIYLINLLTTDFLLTLTLPVKIIVDLGIASWNLRIFHCQVTACFIYLKMYLSIIFLVSVSVDRYLQLRSLRAKESALLLAVSSLCLDPVLYYHLSKSRLKSTGTFAAPKGTEPQQQRGRPACATPAQRAHPQHPQHPHAWAAPRQLPTGPEPQQEENSTKGQLALCDSPQGRRHNRLRAVVTHQASATRENACSDSNTPQNYLWQTPEPAFTKSDIVHLLY